MSGKSDPSDWDPQSLGEFQVEYGKADWNSQAPVEHLIQVAISRIIVILRIAPETPLTEQKLVHHGDLLEGIGACRHLLRNTGTQHVESTEVTFHVDSGIFARGDQE